jgi:hypothetical protein
MIEIITHRRTDVFARNRGRKHDTMSIPPSSCPTNRTGWVAAPHGHTVCKKCVKNLHARAKNSWAAGSISRLAWPRPDGNEASWKNLFQTETLHQIGIASRHTKDSREGQSSKHTTTKINGDTFFFFDCGKTSMTKIGQATNMVLQPKNLPTWCTSTGTPSGQLSF